MAEYGEGMPRGNKSAGYVGLMLAKEAGKKRTDYDPIQRRKKIGKFDINKMSEPSDYIKSAYIDSWKGYQSGNPQRTWPEVRAAASDLKHAVATWARLHPNKDERTIARETGVSQPSVNRYKRLTGNGLEGGRDRNPLTKEEEKMWNDFVLEEDTASTTEYKASQLRKYARNKYEFGLFLVKGIRKVAIITKLVKALKKWYQLVRDMYSHVYYSATDVENRKEELEAGAEEISEMSGIVLPEELIAEEGDPTPLPKEWYKKPGTWGFSDKDSILAKRQFFLRSHKQEMFKAAIVVKQIVAALNKAIEQLRIQDPTKEIKLQEANLDPDADAYVPSGTEPFDRNEELVLADEPPTNPTGSGRKSKKVAKQLYTADGKLYNGLWHQMSDGVYHTGKTHGKRSKVLYLK